MITTSKDAYKSIHDFLSAKVDSCLEQGDPDAALEAAELMEKIEDGKLEFVQEYDLTSGKIINYLVG